MIVDTSAMVAIARREPDRDAIVRVLDGLVGAKISAATVVELTAVMIGKGVREPAARIDEMLREWQIETVPFDAEQASLAQAALRTYGRGSGHPAKLNLGDCYSYALAKAKGEPLLFVGDDFAHTDIRSAL